jgi:hypothetical protein
MMASMAQVKSAPFDVEAEIARLRAQAADVALQQRFAEETRRFVERCEVKYGIPSEEIHQAIDDGRLEETFEVCQWIFEYELLCRAGKG